MKYFDSYIDGLQAAINLATLEQIPSGPVIMQWKRLIEEAGNDSKDYELFLETAATKELRETLKLPLVIRCPEHGLIIGPPTKNNIETWKQHLRSHQQNPRQDGEA